MKNRIVYTLLLSILMINGRAQETVESVLSAKTIRNAGKVRTTKGEWTFMLYTGNMIKAVYLPLGIDRNEQVSDAVIVRPLPMFPAVIQKVGQAEIKWPGNISVKVTGEGMQFSIGQSVRLSLLRTFGDATERGFVFSLQQNERIFGTGERSLPLNRRGYKVPLYNNPWYGYSTNADALNFSMPFVLSDKNYAIFFDNPSKGYLDIGKTNENELRYGVTSGALEFYIIPGDKPSQILAKYHQLTGTQPLPPRWVMGNLVSRFGYTSEAQAKQILQQMKADSVPMDAIIFDLFWFGDSIKNTMGNLDWVNKTAWPDPAKMIADFKTDLIKTILITEPFVLTTTPNYEPSKKFHATDSAGNPFLLTDFYFGKGGLLDLFRKDAQGWFFEKYKKQVSLGVSGWWGDLGEPEKHPVGLFHNLRDYGHKRKFAADEVHNIYGHTWSRLVFENYRKYFPAQRLFHLNRSGYAGSPRYAGFPWTGDVSRSWSGLQAQLPLMQGMSISGVPYVHSDAGGFAGGDGDPELYIRWLQFAAFTPIYRPHGTALGNIEPSAKDIPSESALWPEPARTLGKLAAVTRYRWLPYNYNLCYQQTKNGEPLIKPLFFLNPADSNCYNATDQYLWGNQVMVVPITEKEQTIRRYYIPEGKWTRFHDWRQSQGREWFNDSSITLAHIPLWVKEGSFIPFADPMQRTEEVGRKKLIVTYFPSDKPSRYDLYEDDGENPGAIKQKVFELITFSSSGLGGELVITMNSNGGKYPGQPDVRQVRLDIPHVSQPKSVSINGMDVPLRSFTQTLKGISIPFLFAHQKTVIRIKL